MTNSIGYGSEVPAPPTRRKTKPNMSKAEKQQFYSQKSKKMGQNKNRGHTPAACGSRFFFSIKYNILKM